MRDASGVRAKEELTLFGGQIKEGKFWRKSRSQKNGSPPT